MSLRYYNLIVGREEDGQSLKTFLRRVHGISARSLTVLKYSGVGISRNGELLRAHDILRDGDSVEISLPPDSNDCEPVKGELDILYEDDRVLIVNKPAYMPVHPTKIHQTDTLANIVAYYQRQRGEDYTFRALNRLDKDTSGCVVIAKDRIACSMIKPTVKKTYIAVCEGDILVSGTINAPIGLADDSKIRRCVRDDGAEAITHYRPTDRGNGHTMCEIWLETGRTHQIRCHMSYIGHPLAGDDMYSGSLELIDRQALHCCGVSFICPDTKEEIKVEAPIPLEFFDVIKES